jgi:hypothetical protein
LYIHIRIRQPDGFNLSIWMGVCQEYTTSLENLPNRQLTNGY